MIVSKWDELGVLKRVLEKKLIFIETKVGTKHSHGERLRSSLTLLPSDPRFTQTTHVSVFVFFSPFWRTCIHKVLFEVCALF